MTCLIFRGWVQLVLIRSPVCLPACVCVCVCVCALARISQAGVPGSDWKDLVMEATAEVLKLGPSPVAVLIQALLQFSTKMAAR